jgi:hypothetical protein
MLDASLFDHEELMRAMDEVDAITGRLQYGIPDAANTGFTQMERTGAMAAGGMASAIGRAVTESENRLENLGGAFISIIGSALGALASYGLGSVIPGPVGDILAGRRAGGGPVDAGKAYLVGEKGPEVMVTGSSGTVVPNGALGGETNIYISGTLDLTDPIVVRQVAERLDRELHTLKKFRGEAK